MKKGTPHFLYTNKCGLTFPIKNGNLEEVILRRITRYGVHAPERQACCKMRGQ